MLHPCCNNIIKNIIKNKGKCIGNTKLRKLRFDLGKSKTVYKCYTFVLGFTFSTLNENL